LDVLLRRRFDHAATAADPHRHRTECSSRQPEDVRVELAGVQHGDLLRLTPSRKPSKLAERRRTVEAVNRKQRDRLVEGRDPVEPFSGAVKADRVDAKLATVETLEELDHLALRASRAVGIDEDGNGYPGSHGCSDVRTRHKPGSADSRARFPEANP